MARSPESTHGLLATLDRLIGRIAFVAGQLAALVCAVLIGTMTFSVVVYQQGIAIAWLDDVLRMLLIWLVYLGSVALCFRNDHIAMDAVYLRVPAAMRRVIDLFVGIVGVVLCGHIARYGFDSMSREIDYETLLPSGYLPAWPQTLAIPLGFALMAIAYLSFLYFVLTGGRQRPVDEPDGLPGA
jgi:TRAP-type C4-dicarboxylate transport system permease small subunit